MVLSSWDLGRISSTHPVGGIGLVSVKTSSLCVRPAHPHLLPNVAESVVALGEVGLSPAWMVTIPNSWNYSGKCLGEGSMSRVLQLTAVEQRVACEVTSRTKWLVGM